MREPTRSGATPLWLLCAGLFLAHAAYLACVAEDAHITFRFARHVAQGHGFVWNIGEAPVEGFTSFLWVLLAAAGIRANLDPLVLSQLAGVAAALGTLALTYVMAVRQMGVPGLIAVVPCLMLAVSGPFATWAASGMEMTAFGLFALLGVVAYLSALERASTGRLVASALALSLSTLLRPEGVLFFAVLAGLAATLFWPRTRSRVGAHVLWGAAYAVPLVVFVAWRLQVFGDPLPNTFYQKTGGGFWQHARGAGYVIYFAFYYVLPITILPALLVWEAGLPRLRPLLRFGYWQELASRHPAVTVSAAVTVSWLAAMVYVGGDYMAMYRFMVPLLPFLYLLLVPTLAGLRRAVSGAPQKPRLAVVAVLLAAGATAFHSTPFESSFFRVATWQHGNYRGVQSERRYVARFTLIGRFFETYRQGEGTSLATRSIGAIGYHAESLAIHDLSGLTDRHIARIPVKATNRGWAGHEKWDLDYSFRRLPTYFMLDENLAAEDLLAAPVSNAGEMADAVERAFPTARRFAQWMRDHPSFIEAHYRLVTVRLEDVRNGQAGYFAFLERTSLPDLRRASGEPAPSPAITAQLVR